MRNRPTLILALLAGLIVLAAVGFFSFRFLVSPPSSDSSVISFSIKKGEPVTQIADELQAKGLVRNALVYRLFVRFAGFQDKIQAGDFQLSKNLSLKDLTFQLARGTTDQKITTLEGWRIEEIADYLDSHHIVSKEEFLDAASNNSYSYTFLPNYSGVSLDKPYRRLEGYLFPDTYEIAAQSSADQIIKKMLDNFNIRVTPDMRSLTTKNNLSLAQSIIIASIVEREANSDTDRPIIAGILIKRFQTPGWKLESDVTVQYALGYDQKNKTWWRKDLTVDELNTNSPYNTRLNGGLPPTPISNPSLASITATLSPQTSDYWYWITDKKGIVHYAKTIDEHNQNVAKYLQ